MVFLSNKIQSTYKHITGIHVSPFTTTSRKSIWTEQRFETSAAGSDEEGVLYVPIPDEDDESEVSEELEEPFDMDGEKNDIIVDPLVTKANIGEEDIDMDLSFIEEELDETSLSKAIVRKYKVSHNSVKNPIKHIYARRFFCTLSTANKNMENGGAHFDKQAFMRGPRNANPKPVYRTNKPAYVPKKIYKESDPEVIESRRVFAELLATPMKKRDFLLAMLRWDGPEPAIYNPDYNKTVEPERDEHGYLVELTLEEREEYRREEERLLGSPDESSLSSSSSEVGSIEDLSKRMSLIPRKYFTSVLENQIMRKGKRGTAHSICRNVLSLLRSGYNITNPYIQIEDCLKDLLPLLIPKQLGSARSAKKKVDVQFIDERRSTFLASDWIVEAAKKNSYKGYRKMCVNLCSEIQNVWLGKETSMTKKRDSYYKDIWGMYNFIEDVSATTSLISSDSNPAKTSKRFQPASRKPSKKNL
jgi:ribosomal protein S7